jgi:hypothetical protein
MICLVGRIGVMEGGKMMASGELGDEMNVDDSRRHSRRTALKTGVALGVGVTAWAVPQIGSLGGTPVYAAVCTAPLTGTFLDCVNTEASCPAGTIGYKPLGVTTFQTDGSISFNFNGNNVKGCVPGASVNIVKPSSQAGCRLTVIVHQNNCSSWTQDPYWDASSGPNGAILQGDGTAIVERGRASSSFTAGGNVALPEILCGSGSPFPCGIFTSFVVECTTSAVCIPTT